jgi:rhamnosyltransferase subunit B
MTTWGSLGDLHPYLAVGIGLRERGHRVKIVTTEYYRAKVESEGLEFCASRPDFRPILDRPEVWRRAYDMKTGTEYIVREMFVPHVKEMYEDLLAAAENADVLVSHPLAYAAPIVAEKLGLPWASVALAPVSMFSKYDPPVFAPAPWLHRLRALGAWPFSLLHRLMRHHTQSWMTPIYDLRRRVGLPARNGHPMLEGTFSPYGTLALFSPVFSPPQADWPARTTVCGFPFYDRAGPDVQLSPDLAGFVNAGEPPIVFTLGSSAVFDAGNFYQESAAAAARLGRRAVLLVGTDPRYQPKISPNESLFIAGYAPYSQLLPRSAAIVHQGGIGTMAQSLRSGKPMLVVPFSHDQPDNAMRAERLGVARTVARNDYRAERAASALKALLERPEYSASASKVAEAISTEDGVGAACDALESIARA